MKSPSLISEGLRLKKDGVPEITVFSVERDPIPRKYSSFQIFIIQIAAHLHDLRWSCSILRKPY